MVTISNSSARLFSGSSGLGFAAMPVFDLDNNEKNNFLNQIKNLKQAIVIRDGNTTRADGDVQKAYDFMSNTLTASTGERSYGLLGKVYRRLEDAVAWLDLALGDFKGILSCKISDEERRKYEAYVGECEKAKKEAKNILSQLCTRLGDYCPK